MMLCVTNRPKVEFKWTFGVKMYNAVHCTSKISFECRFLDMMHENVEDR